MTPHTLRRTFISLMLEAGASVPYVMGQVGHAHPDTTLRIYAKVLNRDRSALGQAFDALMEGAVPAAGSDAGAGFGQSIGQTTAETELDRLRAEWRSRRNREIAALAGLLLTRPAGFEPATSRSGGERSIH